MPEHLFINALDRAGNVVLQLKSPWRDGTTHIVLSRLEFMQRWPRWCRDRACI